MNSTDPEAPVVDVLGVGVSRLGLERALSACKARAGTRGGYACFVNAHTVAASTDDRELKRALAGAAFCFADGLPVVWVAKLLHNPIESRVSGPDFSESMLRSTADIRHGFIGGVPGCAEVIAKRFDLDATIYSPPMRDFSTANAHADWHEFLDRCPHGTPPPMVWVGLGAPKQELWLAAVAELAPSVMFFGVGAAFDFLAGTKIRAPVWMRSSGLEWVHRLASEPKRLWKRYAVWNTRFALASYRQIRNR